MLAVLKKKADCAEDDSTIATLEMEVVIIMQKKHKVKHREPESMDAIAKIV